jgi:aspartyl-tRNA(Asn)/glutamyl-tRNA(Gln) amidotransferase subunit A
LASSHSNQRDVRTPSIAEAAARLRDGSLTSVDLTTACLAQIKARDAELKAFITVSEDLALSTAAERDRELRSGKDRGPLHGIPIAHKDLFDTFDIRTTFGSGLFSDRTPKEDSAVARALRSAGGVVVGKTNLPEFATDPAGRNPWFGDLRNPLDPTRSGGGSSGGTAVAIAAGMCVAGTGSDTGGSVRIPASWCGITGLRPSSGLISLAGTHPRAPSLDAAGPMGQTVSDCALMLDALLETNTYASGLDRDWQGLKLGVLDDMGGADADTRGAIAAAVERLRRRGVAIVDVHDPYLAGVDDAEFLDVLLYEFNAAIGERYKATPNRENVYSPVVHANIARGAAVRHEAYEATMALRPQLLARAQSIFKRVDAILTPVTPTTAPKLLGEDEKFPVTRRFTLPTSFLELPSMAIPCGTDSAGLPVGMQIVGQTRGDQQLLSLSAWIERALSERE